MTSPFRRVAAAAVAGALLFVPAASHGAPTRVRALAGDSGFQFSPAQTSIVKGATVKWVESSGTAHRIAFYKKPAAVSGFRLSPNGSAKRTFKKVGIYKYRCTIAPHSTLTDGVCTGMCGVIRVTRP
jgi:plastocyanin